MDRAIESGLRLLSNLLIAVAGICLALMMVHVIADVALKYVANAPIPGTAEIVAHYYMVAAVFLPLPLVELNNRAIFVDLFYHMMRPLLQRTSMLLAYGAQIAFFGVLAWQTSHDAMAAYAKGDLVEGIVNVIIWPGRFFLPIGFWLAVAVSVLRFLQVMTRRDWAEVTSPTPGDSAPEAV